tara:strand:+ start:1106 stop:1282 length:177 start_codon:yes stop_codon:yes gene_type:complete
MRVVKRVQQLYEERNKLFQESGLGDFAYSDAEIEKFVVEAVEKDISNRVNKVIKDSGL